MHCPEHWLQLTVSHVHSEQVLLLLVHFEQLTPSQVHCAVQSLVQLLVLQVHCEQVLLSQVHFEQEPCEVH